MIRSTLTTTFPTMPDMAAVTRTALRQAVKSAPVQRAYARAIAEPPVSQKVKNPTQYMTAKQIRYLFANVALPYQRTGGITDKWKLIVIEAGSGGSVVLENRSKAARYVHGTKTGRDQQTFLRLSGWTPTPEIRAAVFGAVLDEMRRSFTPVLRDAMRVTGGPR
jgi:hypothetical protein